MADEVLEEKAKRKVTVKVGMVGDSQIGKTRSAHTLRHITTSNTP